MARYLVRCEDLEVFRQSDTVVLLDVRSNLSDPILGKRQYEAGHIPGALFVSIPDVVAGPRTGTNGRTPFPDLDRFAGDVGRLGIDNDTAVVIYDNGDCNFACRVWFTFRCLGHDKVFVLDGGYRRWLALSLPVDATEPTPTPTVFTRRPALERVFTVDEVEDLLANRAVRLVDARGHARYLGQGETLDPRGGHIPGSISHPSSLNLNADGVFYAPDALREQHAPLFERLDGRLFVNCCGSGVTACCNHLAQREAGLEPSGVYIGSWSEWCADPSRPGSTDDETL